MTIFTTAFDPDTGEVLGWSEPCDFTSIDQVIELVGGDYKRVTHRCVIYPGIAFSDFPFFQGDIQT